MYVFCIMSGILTLPPRNEFNPRLSAEYLQPALRALFPNPRTIEAVLGGDARFLRQAVEKACTPLFVKSMLGGPFAIGQFKKGLREKSSSSMVGFDDAMALALSLWTFSDSLRGMRERAALRTLQRAFKAYLANKNLERQRSEGIAVPSSPRVAERLASARELDSRLNEPLDPPAAPDLAPIASPPPSATAAYSADNSETPPWEPLARASQPAAPRSRIQPTTTSDAAASTMCDPEVLAVLSALGLGKYASNFGREEVDMEALFLMSEFDLAELHLKKGARVKLRAKVAAMKC